MRSHSKNRKKYISPIGFFVAFTIGIALTMASPMFMMPFESVVCPQDDCSLNLRFRSRDNPYRSGYSEGSYSPVCECENGGEVDIPLGFYVVTFLIVFFIAYFPSALMVHSRNQMRAELGEEYQPSDAIENNVNMGRVLLVILGVVLFVGFIIYKSV